MSMSKRILFDREPPPESLRAELAARREQLEARLTVRIPTRRKNRLRGRHWDPLWPSCLSEAARDLGIEVLGINDGIFVATDAEARQIVAKAKILWEAKAARFRRPPEPVEF